VDWLGDGCPWLIVEQRCFSIPKVDQLSEDFEDDYETDDEFAEVDSDLQTEAEVTCTSCGETVEISLDAGGGTTQEYVEDCPVCCRPWRVHLSYDKDGVAEIWLEES
jgi:hypothetical protein